MQSAIQSVISVQKEAEEMMDQIFADLYRRLSFILGFVYAVLVVWDLYFYAKPGGYYVAGLSAVTSLFFFVLSQLIIREKILVRHAQYIGALGMMVIYANATLETLMGETIIQTFSIILLIVGTGFIFTSRLWYDPE
jgi:predicted membrane protein